MPLTEAEKKILEELKAKEGDTEEEKSKKRAEWIDAQIEKEKKEKEAKETAEKKAKEEEEKKKKKSRLF